MPIIDMPAELLLKRIQREGEGPDMDAAGLAEILPKLGCEVDEVAEMREYRCGVCGKMYDRTEAQGAPLLCSQCGADFRDDPDQLEDLGSNRVIRLDMLAVRPDIFDPGGMARYIRGYLGVETGMPEYVLNAPQITVEVDPRLGEASSLRPHIACAVVRNVKLDNTTIKILMNLQEDLHWALGRDRKLASIGVYDLDTLRGRRFRYEAVEPDELQFVPLGFPPDIPASRMTPEEVLERHKTGQAYAHLLKGFSRYPMLRDEGGTVLSMPPIINSESTRVTLDTQQFFIDVTGLSRRNVDRALNVMVTSLKEIMPEVVLEQVVIEGPGESRVTPDLTPGEMTLDVGEASATIGVGLNAGRLAELLESMGHGVAEGTRGDSLTVYVPPYRSDVMHAVDLIEDAAIAYGYDQLDPELVPTFTIGRPREIEEWSAVARRVMTGLGFHQVMTLVLTSEAAAFAKWGVEADPRAVRIENPISTEQTMCRVSIRPGLLETLAINKQYDLPQYLFEVGDCCFTEGTEETGAREERFLAGAMIGTHVGYADVRAVADAFVHEMGAKVEIRAIEHASFIAGRVAGLWSVDGEQIGVMGEVHPEVLERYGLKHPVSVVEFSLARLLGV